MYLIHHKQLPDNTHRTDACSSRLPEDKQSHFANLCNGFVLHLSMVSEPFWLESALGLTNTLTPIKKISYSRSEILLALHQSMTVVNSCCSNVSCLFLIYTDSKIWKLLQQTESEVWFLVFATSVWITPTAQIYRGFMPGIDFTHAPTHTTNISE